MVICVATVNACHLVFGEIHSNKEPDTVSIFHTGFSLLPVSFGRSRINAFLFMQVQSTKYTVHSTPSIPSLFQNSDFVHKYYEHEPI